MKLTPEARDDLRASWAQMSRLERRKAIRAFGVFTAVDLIGVHPAEVVLSYNGSTTSADQMVRRSLDACRDFFRPRSD